MKHIYQKTPSLIKYLIHYEMEKEEQRNLNFSMSSWIANDDFAY
jgi:hypothetical protein